MSNHRNAITSYVFIFLFLSNFYANVKSINVKQGLCNYVKWLEKMKMKKNY